MLDSVFKKMSKNDLGTTKSHQAGILIPKDLVKRGFFPELDPSQYNPRVTIEIECKGNHYLFNYIHYNSKVFNLGTRNEYRLTGMTKFFRQENILPGDTLQFIRDDRKAAFLIRVQRKSDESAFAFNSDQPLIIRSNWSF